MISTIDNVQMNCDRANKIEKRQTASTYANKSIKSQTKLIIDYQNLDACAVYHVNKLNNLDRKKSLRNRQKNSKRTRCMVLDSITVSRSDDLDTKIIVYRNKAQLKQYRQNARDHKCIDI